MPEGPEVSSVAAELHAAVTGHELCAIAFRQRSARHLPDLPAQLAALPWPLVIHSVACKGKQLVFEVAAPDGSVLWFFSGLGMTGVWSYDADNHTHIEFHFSTRTPLYYNDSRRFGRFVVFRREEDARRKLTSLRDDWLYQPITRDGFRARLQHYARAYPHSYVTGLLTAQDKVCSGIGNYLIAEIMYMCRLHPAVRACDLTAADIDALYDAALALSHRSYNEGGMTISDYRLPSGSKGTFMQSLSVYQRTTDHAGHAVLHMPAPHDPGRRMWWVPELQRER